MSSATATIRELRLNFRSVRLKVEEHGSVVITDNGTPAYELKPVAKRAVRRKPLPDYYARLLKQRSTPISKEDTEALHRENRGEI